jgi:hypothetical protein
MHALQCLLSRNMAIALLLLTRGGVPPPLQVSGALARYQGQMQQFSDQVTLLYRCGEGQGVAERSHWTDLGRWVAWP